MRRKAAVSGSYFALSMASLTLWTLAAGLGYAAVPLQLKIFFAKIDAIGYNSAIALLFMVVLYIGGLEKWADNKWLRLVIFLIPISNLLLIFTNELHGWVWSVFRPVGNNIVVFEHGPGFAWIAFTGYVIVLSNLIILWRMSLSESEITSRQGRLLLAATIFPIIANVVYLYGVKGEEGVDWSSITFSVTGLLFLWALYGARLFDLVPVARDKLVSSLNDGMIVIDTQFRIIDINKSATKMLKSSSEKLAGKILRDVMPDFQSLSVKLSDQEIIVQLKDNDAENHWYEIQISALFDNRNLIVGHLLMFRDITHRKELDEAARQQRNLAEALSDSAAALNSSLEFDDVLERIEENVGRVVKHDSVGVILLDETRKIAKVVGYHDIHNQSVEKDAIQFAVSEIRNLREMLATGAPVIIDDTGKYDGWAPIHMSAWIRSYLGVPITVREEVNGFLSLSSAKINAFTAADASRLQAFVHHAAIAIENAKLYEEVKKLAIIDSPTGIYNRTFFEAELTRMEMGRDYPVSIIIGDLDNLKAVNDLFGHSAGDELIRQVARVLQETFRASDIIARIGGDEFAVLLPKTDLQMAEQMVLRVRAKLAEQNTAHFEWPVYLSLGVSTAEHGRLMDAYSIADQLMYQDKATRKSIN
jgi:diguanylate cyclase (GGDEF)-like protein/PAS domain S-box-containing protein